jgi:DNA-directed RNA polymerase specialized sigma24 family protein
LKHEREPGAPNRSSRWSIVRRAQGAGPEARKALHELVLRYRAFILRMIRYFRHPPDLTAEDASHGFVLWLMEGGLAEFNPGRGRFQPWLTERIRRFLQNEWRKWKTRMRTEASDFELSADDDPERFCEAVFAWEMLLVVLERLRQEAPDPKRFDVLVRFLPGPQMDLVPYAAAARELGITPTHVGKLVCELRAEFKRGLHDDAADLLDPDPDPSSPPGYPNRAAIQRELRHLCDRLCETPVVGIVAESS